MDTLRTVLKDCKLAFHDVDPTLSMHVLETYSNDERDVLTSKFQGIQIKLGCILLTTHHTYQPEYVSTKLHFTNNSYDDTHKLALRIAQDFEVIYPPVLHTKQDIDLVLKPNYIEFTIRFKSKYDVALFIMCLLRFPITCEDDFIL
jgi:hypothetical protein